MKKIISKIKDRLRQKEDDNPTPESNKSNPEINKTYPPNATVHKFVNLFCENETIEFITYPIKIEFGLTMWVAESKMPGEEFKFYQTSQDWAIASVLHGFYSRFFHMALKKEKLEEIEDELLRCCRYRGII